MTDYSTLDRAQYQKIADAAVSKIGCGYIYGATGWTCSPARRQQQAAQYPEYAKSILGKGAKWDGKTCYDCAQFTKAVVKAAGGTLPSGATTQWREGPWLDKGTIDTMPDIPGVMLYREDEDEPGTMKHTGVHIGNGETVDARGTSEGVIRQRMGAPYKWTHWALPKLPEGGGNEVNNIRYRGKVVGGRLNMRGKASAMATIIAYIPVDSMVDVLDVMAPEGWVYVRYEGQTGYVVEEYLQDVEDEPEEAGVDEDAVAVARDDLLKLRGYAAEIVRLCERWLEVE